MRTTTVMLALSLAAMLAGCGTASRHPATPSSAPAPPSGPAQPALRGLVPEPLPTKPSFTLVDTSGRSYRFASATRGKLTYLFFGYTHCPDACPATMSELSYALRLQPAAVRRQIDVVFVTVDPQRDSAPVIRRWLDHYSRTFVGLRGTPAQIAAAERAAGIPTAPSATTAKKKNYTLAHSSLLLAYSPDGRSHVLYAQGFKPVDYAHDMPLLLRFRS
jgi:protein SCO1